MEILQTIFIFLGLIACLLILAMFIFDAVENHWYKRNPISEPEFERKEK